MKGIADLTSHDTFGDCGVTSVHPAWNRSTTTFRRNTFIGYPIPGSTLETVPTRIQDMPIKLSFALLPLILIPLSTISSS